MRRSIKTTEVMTEKEKAAAGFLYNANYDPDILAEIQKCTDMCFEEDPRFEI